MKKYNVFMLFFLLMAVNSVQAKNNNSEYKVTRSDNLTSIINKHYKGSTLSKAQLSIAILAENPTAFQRGNINSLSMGARLRLPRTTELQLMDENAAKKLVGKHNVAFEKGTRKQLAPPFSQGTANKGDVGKLLKSTQALQQNVNQLDQQRVALEARIQALVEVKKRKDAQLKSLEDQIQQSENNQQ